MNAAADFAPFALMAGPARLRAARFAANEPGKVCVLLNGQTEFIEKYFEVIDELRGRGFTVVTMDWRGQGGSERFTDNPLKAHIDDFADYDRDLAALMEQVVRPLCESQMAGSQKPIALAHSMGGHILLRRLHDHQDEFSCAVLCAAMVGIQPRGMPWWLVGLIARAVNRKTPDKNFVWGLGKRDHLTQEFPQQVVTSDPARYARTHDLLAADPSLRLNGPTWGWLAAALKSIMAIHGPGYAEHITTPSLLVGAGDDTVCSTAALHAFADRMPDARYVEIAGARHEILMERDVFRAQFWAAFDHYVPQHA